ncbi:MAG: gamma-glutamyltransferase [Pseudomonadota bacterium]
MTAATVPRSQRVIADAVTGTRAVSAGARLAVDIGLDILADGGNAFDAGVAMVLAEGVALPMKCGLAGDVVALVCHPDGDLECLISVGPGAGALDRGAAPETVGPTSVGVPGAPAGYARLADRGRLPLSALAAPAVRAAREGVAWTPIAVSLTAEGEALLRRHNDDTAYLPDGRLPRVGETLRLPGLADLIDQFAQLGDALFFEANGQILCDRVRRAGGMLTPEDLRQRPAAWHAVDSHRFADGGVLAATPFPTHGPALLRAAALAVDDRVDPVIAARQARAAFKGHETDLVAAGTSVVTATDEDGASVVIVHSNSFPQYGSGLIVPAWELVLNNRPGRGFDKRASAAAHHPAARRVPPTTLHAWALLDDRSTLLGATPGGINQMVWNLQCVLEVRNGHAPADICRSPRWSLDANDQLAIEADHADRDRPGSRHAPPRTMTSAQQVIRLRDGLADVAADTRTGATAGAIAPSGPAS